MKAIKLVVLMALFVASVSSQAQVSVNVNVGTPPVWAVGAPVGVEFYYLPDIGVYYDVPARQYIYISGGTWVRGGYLPARYRGYDLRNGRTVYLTDYHGRTPYVFYKEHKVKYKGNGHWKAKGKGHKKGHGHGHGH